MCKTCRIKVGERSPIPCFGANYERACLSHDGRASWSIIVYDVCVIPVKFCPRCGRALYPSAVSR